MLVSDDGSATVNYECGSKDEAVAFVDRWLDEPLGMMPVIVPPTAFSG